MENKFISKQVMNTAQAHWNEHYLAGGPLGSGRLVFGLVTASVVFGLASQDTAEHALAELGCTGLRFRSPVHHGDTLYAYTEVLAAGAGARPGRRRRGAVPALGGHPRRPGRLRGRVAPCCSNGAATGVVRRDRVGVAGARTASRQRERSERSTRALLDAAGEVIAEVGYGNMTLAAVGERAGYSRGLVTARFGSKEKLLGRWSSG